MVVSFGAFLDCVCVILARAGWTHLPVGVCSILIAAFGKGEGYWDVGVVGVDCSFFDIDVAVEGVA